MAIQGYLKFMTSCRLTDSSTRKYVYFKRKFQTQRMFPRYRKVECNSLSLHIQVFVKFKISNFLEFFLFPKPVPYQRGERSSAQRIFIIVKKSAIGTYAESDSYK